MLAGCLNLIDEEEDKLTFRKLYDTYERRLFAYSMSILHNISLSEEAVSETFLAVAENFQKIKKLEMNEITAYIVIINRNACYDILKKENRQKSIVLAEEISESAYTDDVDIEAMLVCDAVKTLPDIYRDVIMMKYFYGFSIKEISKQFHLSIGGVKSRLEKARKILRNEIDPDD